MPSSSHEHRDADSARPGSHGGAPLESGAAGPTEIEGRQRQQAVLAERDPASIASALAAFRKRRGFERSSLAAWLRLSPDRLVALVLERRPDPSDPDYATAVVVMAHRYGADPVRLTEALAG